MDRQTDRQTNKRSVHSHPHIKTYKYSICKPSVNDVTLYTIHNLLFTVSDN